MNGRIFLEYLIIILTAMLLLSAGLAHNTHNQRIVMTDLFGQDTTKTYILTTSDIDYAVVIRVDDDMEMMKIWDQIGFPGYDAGGLFYQNATHPNLAGKRMISVSDYLEKSNQ